jgi:hypothetical protein
MYSYFTFLELVKAISVHRAHRLLPEATLILCTWRNRLSVTVSGFDRLLSGNATNYRRKNTRLDGAYKMGRGKIDNPNVTFAASDEDWVSMSNKTLKVPWAYVTGRLKIQGSHSLVKKLDEIFP